ncbi:MAG: T9SS type A sorting domain-containing protein [Bacteroidetes bacterium]|nr:T9SS type A sorting domain-containing protein [Bacteroidota bacterium]
MNKFIILVAIMATSTLCWANPTILAEPAVPSVKITNEVNLKDLHSVPVGVESFNASKNSDVFQESNPERITYGFIQTGNGPYAIGPWLSYVFTYEPISNTIFSISPGRLGLPGDSVQKIGIVTAAKYEKNKVLPLFKGLLWNQTSFGGVSSIIRNEWQNPSIAVANPLGVTDLNDPDAIRKLKIIVNARLAEYPAYSSTGNWMYSWFGTANTSNLDILPEGARDNEANILDFTSTQISEVSMDLGPNDQEFAFTLPMKSHICYFDGIPHSVHFAKLFGKGSRNINYGIISFKLDDINANVNNEVRRIQVLPPSILDIFGASVLDTLNSQDSMRRPTTRPMNIDYDNNNNIYFAFNNCTYNVYSTGEYSNNFEKMPIFTVLKCKFKDNYEDIFDAATLDIDTIPMDVIRNYVLSQPNGHWATYDENTCPSFNISWHKDRYYDTPFIVNGENDYSFILAIEYALDYEVGEVGIPFATHLVEIRSKNKQWSINKIYDVEKTWLVWNTSPGLDIFTDLPGYNLYTGYYYNDGRVCVNDASIWAEDEDSGELTFTTYGGTAKETQLARTKDGQYIIAKWRETDSRIKTQITTSPINFLAFGGIGYPNAGPNPFPYSTDTLYCAHIKLAYRHVDSAKWSEPRAIYGKINDSISFGSTYMPRIVPSVDEVLISFRNSLQQYSNYPIQETLPAIARYNFASYLYADLINPSARHGMDTWGIKNYGPAEVNNLEVYPNPTGDVTTFKFSLLKSGNAKLTIQNALGQEVVVLANTFCDANEYAIDYDVTNLPVGVYYFTLTSGGFTQTKPFTVVR